jgi:uncharacterized membrane protein YccC
MSRASLVFRSLEALNREGRVEERVRSKLDEISAALAPLSRGQPSVPHDIAEAKAAGLENDEYQSEGASALELLALHHATILTASLAESCRLAIALTEPSSTKYAARPDAAGPRFPLYCDQPLALLSGASACAATLVACLLWIETSWPEGFVAAQFAAIGCSLFATLDTPTKPIFEAVAGIFVALPVAALYEFAIFPGLDGFPSLALVLTPLLLFFSYLQTFERLEGAGMVLAIAFAGALALQESFASDFASFVNSNLAEVAGLLIGAAMLLVFRTIDPAWNARRLLRSGWAVVRELARSDTPIAWLVPMFDRSGQAAIRLAGCGPDAQKADVLLGLRVGLNVVELRRCGATLGGTARGRIDDTLQQLGNLKSRSGSDSEDSRRKLSGLLGRLSAVLRHLPTSRERMVGIAAIIGLRLDLDPRLNGSEAVS